MKLIIQPKFPFYASPEYYAQIVGDFFIDDDNVVFKTSGVPVVIRREDLASVFLLPEDTDLAALGESEGIFKADV